MIQPSQEPYYAQLITTFFVTAAITATDFYDVALLEYCIVVLLMWNHACPEKKEQFNKIYLQFMQSLKKSS